MFSVVTDTSANLDCELAKERNMHIVPFHYFVNGEDMTCKALLMPVITKSCLVQRNQTGIKNLSNLPRIYSLCSMVTNRWYSMS